MDICRKGELTVVLCLMIGCHGLVMTWALPVEGSPGKPSHGEMVLNHCAISLSAGHEEQADEEHRLENPGTHCQHPKAIPPNPTGFRLRGQNLMGPNPTPLCTQLFTWGTRHNSSPSCSLPSRSLQQPGTPGRIHSWLSPDVPGKLDNKGHRWPWWPVSCRAVLSALQHPLQSSVTAIGPQ